MKRKVFVGVLTALVLVSFIACQNSTPMSPIYGKQVQSVTLASAPDYIYGSIGEGGSSLSFNDTIVPSEIELEVTYNDNSSEVYTGAELGLASAKINGANTPLTVTFGYTDGSATAKANEFTVTVPAYEVEGVSIDVSGIKETDAVFKTVVVEEPDITAEVASISLDGIKVSAIYNGSSSKDVTDKILAKVSAYPVPGSILTSEDAKTYGLVSEDEKTITVSQAVLDAVLADTKEELPLSVTIVGTKSFNVVDAAEIVSVRGFQTAELFPGISGKDTLANAGIVLELTDAEGNKTLVSEGVDSYKDENGKTIDVDDSGWTLSFREYTADYTLTNTSAPYMVTVTATKNNESYKTDEKVSVSLTVDYAVEFKAELTDKDQTFTAGETIEESDFTFTVTEWAGNGTTAYTAGQEPTTYDSSDFTAYPATIKEGQEDTKSYTVSFYFNDDPDITVEATVEVDNTPEA